MATSSRTYSQEGSATQAHSFARNQFERASSSPYRDCSVAEAWDDACACADLDFEFNSTSPPVPQTPIRQAHSIPNTWTPIPQTPLPPLKAVERNPFYGTRPPQPFQPPENRFTSAPYIPATPRFAQSPIYQSDFDYDGGSESPEYHYTPSSAAYQPPRTPQLSVYTSFGGVGSQHSNPNLAPRPSLQIKVEHRSDRAFAQSRLSDSEPRKAVWSPNLFPQLKPLSEPRPSATAFKVSPVFEHSESARSPNPFVKSEPRSSSLKSLDSAPDWLHQPELYKEHKHTPLNSSPLKLKSYPRPRGRPPRSGNLQASKPEKLTGIRKRQILPRACKSETSLKSHASSRGASPSLAVKLPVRRERLQALEDIGDIQGLKIPVFPGDVAPRYIKDSDLGLKFSYFGTTRLLRTFRPGLQILRLVPIQAEIMAPTYRNQNRRQNRPAEHDIFEGLPVRQWRKENITIAPPPSNDNPNALNDIWAIELPHGMPKDSHMLPQHSQDLLRAARSGKIYAKRPAPEEEEVDPEVILPEKPDKKEDDTKIQGYTVKTWKQIPRHQEGPDVEYLAKRRKNLVTAASKAAIVPSLTKATVKKTDATGAEYLQEVVVSHGQQIDGEVVSQTTIPDPNAQALDPYAAPTPPKRNRPAQKKRPKGPGRGRKKGRPPGPTSVPPAAPVEGAPVAEAAAGTVNAEGIKAEPEPGAVPVNNEDVEMVDGSNAASDDDDDDDGEEGDDDEGSSNQGSPAKRPRTSSPIPSSLPTMDQIPDLSSQPAVPAIGVSPVSPFAPHIEKERQEAKSGSPLKNVALATSALTSPLTSPVGTAAPPFFDSTPIQQAPAEVPVSNAGTLDTVMQDAVPETAPTALPPPPPEPTIVEEIAAVQTRLEEEEEEEMLLDIVENANNAQVGMEAPAPVNEPVAVREPEIPAPIVETPQPIAPPEPQFETPAEPVPEPEAKPEVEALPELALPPKPAPVEVEVETAPEPVIEPPTEATSAPEPETVAPIPAPAAPEPKPEPAPEPAAAEDDNDFPDLLGGLEKSLNKPAPVPKSPV